MPDSPSSARFLAFVFRTMRDLSTSAPVVVTQSGAMDDAPGLLPTIVVVEIFQRDDGDDGLRWSLLVSIPDAAQTYLRCIFAVSNLVAECDRLASLGFPVVEGRFSVDGDALTIDTACYPTRSPGDPSVLEIAPLLTVYGIRWNAAITNALRGARKGGQRFNPVYRTLQSAPDLACPDTQMTGLYLDITPNRDPVVPSHDGVTLEIKPALYPDLQNLIDRQTPAIQGWAGYYSGEWTPVQTDSRRIRFRRRSVFGPPSFVFDDMEIVGFRTELNSSAGLLAPLNFHLSAHDNTATDFRYEAASSTITIEMIRYGKMRGRNVPSPFSAADFMSQHELLARVVVGRVDDDTAQARDAALFVPTIFVDNPWSKLVGRQMQGFPKGLAEFRALVDDAAHFPVPLAMDGTERDNPGGHPIPFYRITEVHLTTRVDEEQEPQPMKPGLQDASRVKNRILKVECDDIADGSALEFTGPDLTSVFSSIAARRSPWDQFDFDEAEFRRAFAQSIVVGNGFRGFRVVQVSPVDPSVKLEKAWILGRYTLSNVRVAFPTKGATLVFFSPDSAPQTWKALCAQLPGAEVALSTGNWYRVKCSMELQFDDGLDW